MVWSTQLHLAPRLRMSGTIPLLLFFYVHVTILIIKPTRCTNFSNLFWNETLYVSDSSSVHHQDFFTVHTAMVRDVIQVYIQPSSRIRMFHPDPARKQQTCMTYTIAVCTVKNSWWWTEELSKTSRVSFQNKFEKLVHLVGFIIRTSTPSLCLRGVGRDNFSLFKV